MNSVLKAFLRLLFTAFMGAFCVNCAYADHSRNSSGYISAAADGGRIRLLWTNRADGGNKLLFMKSEDDGSTWSEEKSPAGQGPHKFFSPSLSSAGNTLHACWVDYGVNGNGDIRYLRSPDGGTTWDRELVLVDESDGTLSLKVFSFGADVHLTWRNTQGKMFIKSSYNNGETWKENVYIGQTSRFEDYNNPPELFKRDSEILYVWDDAGKDTAGIQAYVDVIPLLRGGSNLVSLIGYRTSADNGKTWSRKTEFLAKLVEPKEDFIDMQYPCVKLNNGLFHMFWAAKLYRSRYELFYRRFSENPKLLIKEKKVAEYSETVPRASCEAAGSGIYACWLKIQDGSGEIRFVKSIDAGVTWQNEIALSDKGSYMSPVIIASPAGKLHVFYGTDTGETIDIKCKTSSDNGETWTEPK